MHRETTRDPVTVVAAAQIPPVNVAATTTTEERFDAAMAFGSLDPDHGVNMLRVCLYNVQDCSTVYHLMRNIDFLDMVVLYARHFVAPVVLASYAGNSRLLPNAFAVRSLCESRTVLHRRDNRLGMFTIDRGNDDAARRRASRYTPREWLDCLYSNDDSVVAVAAPLSSLPGSSSSNTGDATSAANERRMTIDRTIELIMQTSPPLISDELDLMRIGDKVYRGGVNMADPAHYAWPISVDFASFYPSIGCQFNLSMETVRVLTVEQLIRAFGNARMIDEAIERGLLRIFDYEPDDSSLRVPATEARVAMKGRDELAREVLLANDGWYESVEFSDVDEMIGTSVDVSRRRVLLVYSSARGDTPVIVGLWRYYLAMRQRYKAKRASASAEATRRVFTCVEKMYKVVANSLYGYLNYQHSAIYSPAVSAAVTSLARKVFKETEWIVTRLFPRELRSSESPRNVVSNVIYEDTDGIMVRVTHLGRDRGRRDDDDDGRNDDRERQIADERDLVRLVNGTFRRYGQGSIVLEAEDSGAPLCTIMGKKKYWKVLSSNRYITKGFERNAQSFIKHLVRTLQRNVSLLISACPRLKRLSAFRLVVARVDAFFEAAFDALDAYYRRHGVDAFAFGQMLNPRNGDGPEAAFVQSTLSRYGFAIGDRAKCVFALQPDDPTLTRFMLVRDFNGARGDRLNYYKFIRRVAMYLLQMVEGFKRTGTNDPYVEEDVRMSAARFDETLRRAYRSWLQRRDDDDDDDECRRRRRPERSDETTTLDYAILYHDDTVSTDHTVARERLDGRLVDLIESGAVRLIECE